MVFVPEYLEHRSSIRKLGPIPSVEGHFRPWRIKFAASCIKLYQVVGNAMLPMLFFAVIINSTSNLEPASPHKKCHRKAVSKLRPSKSDAWSIIRLSKWPWIGYPAFLRQTHIILSPRWLTELVERNWCIKNWTCVNKKHVKKNL